MSARGLGVVLDSFRQEAREALTSASRLGFREVELPAVGGQVDPANLDRSGRRHLLHYVSGLGLELSALTGDPGGARFSDVSLLERHLDKTRQVLELAAELRVPVVTTHLGRIDPKAAEGGDLEAVVRELADLSDRTGTRLAFETGSAAPESMAALLKRVGCPTLGVCYDPASLLIDGLDPLAGVEPLADQILLARARDAVAGAPGHAGRETVIGEGEVDFAAYLAGLEQAGYGQSTFVRRTRSDAPLREIADAKARLERLIA